MSKKIGVLLDSCSGISQKEAKTMGVHIIPTPFFVNEEMFLEDVTMSVDELYEILKGDANVTTSQPSPGDLIDKIDELLKEYDQVIYIPISAGLSSTYATGEMVARDYEGKLFVLDSRRVAGSQKSAAINVLKLIENGYDGSVIKEKMEMCKDNSVVYLAVENMDRLKKGGRVTPTAAAIGNMLNIKPVLIIGTEKIESFSKVRGMKAAKRKMLDAIANDLETKFAGKDVIINVLSAAPYDETVDWLKAASARFPAHAITAEKIAAAVACHTGVGCLAITCSEIIH
mgnify:CR=1 FL=1